MQKENTELMPEQETDLVAKVSSVNYDDDAHTIKKRFKEESKQEKERLAREKRLIELDGKKNKKSKGEIKMAIAAAQINSAKQLSARSKEQLIEQFQAFDVMVLAQVKELNELIDSMPSGITMPETFTAEMARLTDNVEGLKRQRTALFNRTQAINVDEPILANAELLDISAELSSLQMELAAAIMPAVMDLHQIANNELRARK